MQSEQCVINILIFSSLKRLVLQLIFKYFPKVFKYFYHLNKIISANYLDTQTTDHIAEHHLACCLVRVAGGRSRGGTFVSIEMSVISVTQ